MFSKNIKKTIIGTVILGALLFFLLAAFKKNNEKYVDNKQQITALQKMPAPQKQQTVVIDEKKRLADNFPKALREHAHHVFKNSVLADVDPDGAIQFENERLILDLSLKRRIDSFLLLYPEVDIEGIRYLISQESVFTQGSNRQAQERFAQVDAVLKKYFKLHTRLKAGPLSKPTEVNFVEIFDKLSQLRKEVLGEELAEAFFAEEEQYTREHIPQTTIQASEVIPEKTAQ